MPDAVVPDGTDGIMRLRTDQRAFNGYPYTSGIITTYDHFSQTYGYFEARIRQPETRGFWPGFWLFAQQRVPSMNWGDEFDIMENHTVASNAAGHNWHFHSFSMNGGVNSTHSSDLGADYHIYGIEWRQGLAIYYVDGVEVYRITGTSISSQPMFILLNVAVDVAAFRVPDNTTAWPQSMDIDYVRAYQFNDSPAEPNIPIKSGPVILSSYVVSPGDVVNLEADLDVGNADLTGPVYMGLGFGNFNGAQIQYVGTGGVTKIIGWSNGVYTGPSISGNYTGALKANQRAAYRTQFTVPSDMPSGIYNIAYRPSINGVNFSGTTIAARFYVNNPQSSSGPTVLLPLSALPNPVSTGSVPSETTSVASLGIPTANKPFVIRGETISFNTNLVANRDFAQAGHLTLKLYGPRNELINTFSQYFGVLHAGDQIALRGDFKANTGSSVGAYSLVATADSPEFNLLQNKSPAFVFGVGNPLVISNPNQKTAPNLVRKVTPMTPNNNTNNNNYGMRQMRAF